jgi:hypothetical protein
MTAYKIVQIWKEEIESINIRGYQRKIESVDCFQMSKYYTGEEILTDCWKVSFNFSDGLTSNEVYLDDRTCTLVKSAARLDLEWSNSLEQTFIQRFGEVISKDDNGVLFHAGTFVFHNEICDYMTNQGYRFIIQFYLPGVLSKLRQEKLNQLIN